MARCPAHDDRKPSLSIKVAEGHRILVHCFAGCPTEKVMESIGLDMSALTGDERTTPLQHASHARRAKTWKTIEDAASAFACKLRAAVESTHVYENDHGAPCYCVVRLRKADDSKTFRPVHFRNGAWLEGGPNEQLPVYRLGKAAEADQILVVEGEKCVEEAARYGITATTSAHGANSAAKTNWSPLAGKAVIIWPDNDDAGRRYARDVAGLVRSAGPDASLRVIMPDGLPPGGDLVDWVHACEAEGLDPPDIAERLAITLEAASPWSDDCVADSEGSEDSETGSVQWPEPHPSSSTDRYQPFLSTRPSQPIFSG